MGVITDSEIQRDRILGTLEEYKTIRAEMLKRQESRLFIVGFTVAAIGTIIGLTLKPQPVGEAQGIGFYGLFLDGFGLLVLVAAQLLTIRQTQQNAIMAEYLRRFIEPVVPGIRWESRWTCYRKLNRTTDEPLGTSAALALYYTLLTAAVYAAALVIGLHRQWMSWIIVSLLALWSWVCSLDLLRRTSRGWQVDWTGVTQLSEADVTAVIGYETAPQK